MDLLREKRQEYEFWGKTMMICQKLYFISQALSKVALIICKLIQSEMMRKSIPF